MTVVWPPLIALLILLPSLALPEALPVQSGEHKGFSRLVTQIPPDTKWSVEHIGQAVVLTVAGQVTGFETASIFDRIPRTRIAETSVLTNQLVVQLACDCSVSAFSEGSQYVVIDVASPGVLLPTRTLVQESGTLLDSSIAATLDAKRRILSTGEPILRQAVELPLLREPKGQMAAVSGTALQNSTVRLGLPEIEVGEAHLLSSIQHEIAREIGSAATQGLLTPKRRTATDQNGPHIEDPEAPQERRSKSSQPLSIEPTPENHIRISTSRDLPNLSASFDLSPINDGQTCPDIAVELWGTETPFLVQVSLARAGLFAEFDRLDRAKALQLAKTYAYFGFGVEAMQTLKLDSSLFEQNPLIYGIAHLLEYGASKESKHLSQYIECDVDIALWAALSVRNIPTGVQFDSDAAIHALNKLPAHLRQIIAPMLSRTLVEYGDTTAAAAALRTLDRLPGASESEALLAQAEIDLELGNSTDGEALLVSIVESNASLSPNALVTLVESRLNSGQPISVETAELIEAYAQEFRRDPIGPQLRRAHIIALAKSGQFDHAFTALARLSGQIDGGEAIGIRQHLIDMLAEAASDIIFLNYMFEQEATDLAQLNANSKLAVAQRLVGLGFAEFGQEILVMVPMAPFNLERQTLAAQIALALGQPIQAQAALVGVPGQEAQILRAKAKQLNGRHAEAHDLYVEADLADAAAQSAWLSEGWQDLILHDTPLFGRVSALEDPSEIIGANRDGMLERTSKALEESASARDVIADLLADTKIDVYESDDSVKTR